MLAGVCSGHRPPEAVPHQGEPIQAEGIDHGGDIAGEGGHRVVSIPGGCRFPVAPEVQGHRPAAGAQVLELRRPLGTVATVAVNEQDREAPGSPIVDPDLAAVSLL